MEDFDYIDELAKNELSDRTVAPSADGWNVVQQKIQRRKRRRILVYVALIALICSLGLYVGVETFNGNEKAVSKTNSQDIQ